MKNELLNNSYKEYPVNRGINLYALASYQRCFRCPTDKNKLYFVNVNEYEATDGETENRFEATAQFRNEKGLYFNISMLPGWDNVEELNLFFSDIYYKMHCLPYSA